MDDLAGRRVLLTQQRAGPIADRLAALGVAVDRVALTEAADPHDGGAALAGALARAAEFDWLVVTSVNGARRVGQAARRCAGVRLATVGKATADALAALAGRPVDLVPAVQRVEGLLAEFPDEPAVVLAAQGDRASPALVDGLRERGHTVTAVEAYRTAIRALTGDEARAVRAASVVVLASGSAAAALADLGSGTRPVVALGPVTAAAARDAGLTVTAVAASPSDEDVVDAIRRSVSPRTTDVSRLE